jgi:hypothetical protein
MLAQELRLHARRFHCAHQRLAPFGDVGAGGDDVLDLAVRVEQAAVRPRDQPPLAGRREPLDLEGEREVVGGRVAHRGIDAVDVLGRGRERRGHEPADLLLRAPRELLAGVVEALHAAMRVHHHHQAAGRVDDRGGEVALGFHPLARRAHADDERLDRQPGQRRDDEPQERAAPGRRRVARLAEGEERHQQRGRHRGEREEQLAAAAEQGEPDDRQHDQRHEPGPAGRAGVPQQPDDDEVRERQRHDQEAAARDMRGD